jgi:tetratricopeptide (TPR) repeat protein
MNGVKLLKILCWMWINWVAFPLSGQTLDSLKDALSKERSDENRIGLLKAIGEIQIQVNPADAISYFEELILISQQQDDQLLESYALNKIGNCWFYLNDFKQSTQFYFKALESTEEQPAYYDLISRIYNNLGWSFKKFEDYEKALQYFLKAEDFARKTGDQGALGLILNNKGVTQKDLKKFDAALASLNESLKLNQETGNMRQERFNLNNISVIYIELNRYDDAIQKLKQLLVLNEELRDTVELINNLENLGRAYVGMKDYPHAESALLMALEYTERNKRAEMKQMILSELSSLYRLQGKMKEALDYFKEFYVLSDSLKTQETKRYALELETKYNSLMKEKELESARTELAEQKLYFTWIVGALVIAIVLVIFAWRTIILKRKNEQKLLGLYNEIEYKAQALQQANNEIIAINNNLEKLIVKRTETIQIQNERLREFAFMNAHRIRGPVASILGIVNLLVDSRNERLTQDLIQHLQTSASNLDTIINEVTRQLEEDIQIKDTTH